MFQAYKSVYRFEWPTTNWTSNSFNGDNNEEMVPLQNDGFRNLPFTVFNVFAVLQNF
jgi:hypothetical protein